MNRKRSSLLLLISTAIVTTLVVIGILYLSGFRQRPASSESLVHQEGMVHMLPTAVNPSLDGVSQLVYRHFG